MEISATPPNIFHRLMLVTGNIIMVGQPLPGGGEKDPKVWLIGFTPTKTDSELLPGGEDEPDGESRWTHPAKYKVLMREADGTLGDEVQVHEVPADKVLLATRLTSKAVAIEEFTALIREELGEDAPVDVQGLVARPQNGQQVAATP
jgi:hypothetical protein